MSDPGSNVQQEQRRIERQQLSSYLRVFNRHSGRPMGYLGNISRQGMMLISDLPIMLGSCYELQLRLPGPGGSVEFFDFTAMSHWCRPDENPGHYDSGFSIVHNQQAFAGLAGSLTRYFSFQHPVDA
ncbi:PilZ domain-containing protein [Halopseudomonas sp.]|uniref:PilZ domain-containing protein n=1 Tax=Halopseudomonas sp. TaxID=2901191 RepID=UPI003565F420